MMIAVTSAANMPPAMAIIIYRVSSSSEGEFILEVVVGASFPVGVAAWVAGFSLCLPVGSGFAVVGSTEGVLVGFAVIMVPPESLTVIRM